MNAKKSVILLLFIGVLFFTGKTSLMLSAAENSGYAVLVNSEDAPISFAGVNFSLSDDLTQLSLDFQMTDSHTFEGKQGIEFSIICGGKRDKIVVDSNSLTRTDDSFFSINNTLNQLTVFFNHSNMKMSFEISFNKKLSDTLILEAEFIDATGVHSKKSTCVLYDADESLNVNADTKENVPEETDKVTKTSRKSENNAETSASRKKSGYNSYSQYSNNSYNNTIKSNTTNSASQKHTSEVAVSSESAVYKDTGSGDFGAQQIISIILAAFLVAAALVCIVLGIKKSKVN